MKRKRWGVRQGQEAEAALHWTACTPKQLASQANQMSLLDLKQQLELNILKKITVSSFLKLESGRLWGPVILSVLGSSPFALDA